jgi:hypothetical protein
MIVMSTGISINTSYGEVAKRRLEAAAQQAIEAAHQNGLNDADHGTIIRQLWLSAHDLELEKIKSEEYLAQINELKNKLQLIQNIL